MDITWYGHNCFRLTERGETTVVTDPFEDSLALSSPPRLKGDVVTISHDAPFANNAGAVKGHSYVLAGPGEYEIGGVFIYGVAMHTVTESLVRVNVAYVMRYGDLKVAHMGSLSHVPDQSTMEQLGEVNVAILPVGGGGPLSAALAAEVVAMLEPSYIVPMDYALSESPVERDSVERFLKTMGVSKAQEMDSLRVTGSSLPEQPQIVLLTPQT